jgi:ATP/ADP translocase
LWQGIVTGGLMVLSPAMFERMGWKGVAGATPIILLWGGVAFFSACMGYQYFFGGRRLPCFSLAQGRTASLSNA